MGASFCNFLAIVLLGAQCVATGGTKATSFTLAHGLHRLVGWYTQVTCDGRRLRDFAEKVEESLFIAELDNAAIGASTKTILAEA